MSKHREILKQYWGYDNFRELQEEIINSIYDGKDTLGLMPTGGGKSITFQVPAMTMNGLCLVITPLIALMKDQVKNLRLRNIKATAIYTGMSRADIITALENCEFGKYKFLYISPERLDSDLFKNKIKYINVSMITVDESHCISQWGYDFRPSYLNIAEIRKLKPEVPILALTATATPVVVKDIQDKLLFKSYNVFQMSYERKNLAYVIRKTENKENQLLDILKKTGGSAIVYVRSRQKTKEVSELLNKEDIASTYYHAGISNTLKDERQKLWSEEKVRVIVATNAFGMGIDKSNVRVVIHLDLPDSIEAYFQEAGRAGRDRQKSYSVILLSKTDKTTLRKRIEDSFPPKEYIKQVYEHLSYYYQIGVGEGEDTIKEFNLEKFCFYFKHFPTRAYNALKILTQAGYIEHIDEQETKSRVFFSDYEYTVRKLNTEVETDTQKIITAILRTYSGVFTDPIYINEDIISAKTKIDKEKVYRTLLYLSRTGEIKYIPKKRTEFISYRTRRLESKDIHISKEIYEEKKAKYKEKVEAMLAYAYEDIECRSRTLLRYFGEDNLNECGMCDVCINKRKENKAVNNNSIRTKILNATKDESVNICELPKIIGEDIDKTSSTLKTMLDKGEVILKNNSIFIAEK